MGSATGRWRFAGAGWLPAPARTSIPAVPIEIQEFKLETGRHRGRISRLPVLRGVLALWGSLAIGMRALTVSADIAVGEPGEEISSGMWTGALVVSIVFAVALFFVEPRSR